MSTPESYIDRCVAAVKSIDPVELAQVEVGRRISGSGGEISMRSLGRISILGEDIFCGLKIPKQYTDIDIRTQLELGSIEMLLSRLPEFRDQVPYFMALLTIEGSRPVAQITEDASQAGTLAVWPQIHNSQLADVILETFSRPDDLDIFVNEESAEHNLSFLVDGKQRLLDFTPRPVYEDSLKAPIAARIYNLVSNGALSIDIRRQSQLAQSLELLKSV